MFDPWLDDNPVADIGTEQVTDLDYILATHGHYDHFDDAIPLALKTGATLVGTFEIAAFAELKGVEKTQGMSIGGGLEFPFGYAKMTPALHGGQVSGDEEGKYTTMPAGWWLDLNGKRLYHAGDTSLLLDMQLLKGQVDIALLPIGDCFTMGPRDAARAVEFIEPKIVVPVHYNTFDLIAQDPAKFAALVGGRAEVRALKPGEALEF